MATIDQNVRFNYSMYQENAVNRWKFLEPLDPDQAQNAGWLVTSPVPVVSLTTSYLLFVCFVGPLIMRNREPFQMKSLIRFYNLIMVFLAGYLLYRLYDAIESLGDMFSCSKTFNFEDESGTKIYRMANLILTVRLSEYLDTIFFTLRKKQSQVTFLHVFHHAFVPVYAYWILRTAPLRFNVFIIIINSFIHVLMYFYYFLATYQQPRDTSSTSKTKSAKGESTIMLIVYRLLMFKKYMTQLQILQFVSLAFYAIYAVLQKDRCSVPWTYIIANFLLAFGFLSLFLHFYMRVYKSSATGPRIKRD